MQKMTEAAMVATLTLNPAVDVTYHVENLVPDQKAHATSARFDPGGNGINVGRGLKKLNVPAHNFCVTAGETGHLLERMLSDHIANMHYERVEGETRINTTILEQNSGKQFEISGIGPILPPPQRETLLADFIDHAAQGFGILTGSTPPDISPGLYGELVLEIRQRGGCPVVDTHDDDLRLAIEAQPFLIKPNRYELETLIGKELPTLELVAEEARRIQQKGVDYVCVSLGNEGAVLTGPENSCHAGGLPIPIKSTVGAGDSMVAGLVTAFIQGLGLKEALRLAVSCGTGTACQPGTQLFTSELIKKFSPQITIRSLNI